MKTLGCNAVDILKDDFVQLVMDKETFGNKFASMKAGTYENCNGSEFECIVGLNGDCNKQYIRLHAPWSPNNINICWKLEVYNWKLGTSQAKYVYTFKSMGQATMEWFIMANLMYTID